MKRILKGLIFGFAGVLAISLASCGKVTPTPTPKPEPTVDPVTPTPAHTHSLVDGWKRDSASHWHECSTCDDIVDLANHTYGDWVVTEGECTKKAECTICKFVKTENIDHDWDEWKEQEDGSMAKTCKHCGRVESVVQYYVRGTLNDWGASDDYKLEVDYENMTSSITVSLTAGDNFKVADANWSGNANFGFDNIEFKEGLFQRKSEDSDDIVVLVTADYKITVSGLAGSEHKVTIEQLCVHEYNWPTPTTSCEITANCIHCEAPATKVVHDLGEWTVVANKTCDFVKECSRCDYAETKTEHKWHKPEGSVLEVCERGCGAVNVLDYYIKGSVAGNSNIVWGASDDGKFTVAKDGKSSSYILVLAVGDEFKVGSEKGWEFNAGNATINVPGLTGTDNITCTAAGVYVVTVSGLDSANHSVSIDPVQLYVRGDAVGTWDASADNALVYDKETDTATFTIEIADITKGFKVAPAEWGLLENAFNIGSNPSGEGFACAGNSGNITVAEAGNYIIKVSGLAAGAPVLTIEKGEGEVEPIITPVPDMWIRGSFDAGWAALDAYKLAEGYVNPLLGGQGIKSLNINVYLEKDTSFKVGSEDWTYSFGENATYAEGLFDVVDGNLKVKTSGYYVVYITGYDNKATAVCNIELRYTTMTLADAKAAAANTGIHVIGTVKSINEQIVVITDGTVDLNVNQLGHVHVGDQVEIKGIMGANEDTPQVNKPAIVNVDVVEGNSLNAILTKVTSVDQLVDGVKVILSYGDFVMGAQSGTMRTSIYSKDHLDAHQSIVTLVKSGDNWKLQVEDEKYLYYSGSGNSINTGVEKAGETGDYTLNQADWTIAINDGVLTIVNVANNERYLQYNIGSPRFACYKNTQNNIDLYIIQSVVENYSVSELVHGTDYKNQTLFDGKAVKIETLSGSIKADSNEEIHEGAIQLKLDKDIDGETIKNKGLLFTAKEDCTLVLTVCASGSNKGWIVTSNDVEVASGSVDKNGGAISIITLNVKAGESYRFSSPAGGIRFESVAVYKNI